MTSAYTQLFARALFPLHERLKGHNTTSVRRWLESTQWWDREALRTLQTERLRALLLHAGEHVPYYRRLFAERQFDPAMARSVSDIQDLPLLNKSDIRKDPEAFKSELANGLQRLNTGGSSGEPLIFWISKERVSHDVAAKWRATRWWDVDIGDPEIVLWGSPIELGKQDRLKLIRDQVQRSLLLPAFEMSDKKVQEFIQAILRRRPRMLFGYPSALAHIARHAEEAGINLKGIGCRVAFVTAERLYDHQRALISRVFGCHVANGYGGRDAGFVAHECPHGGMHITAEDIVVEIVDPQGRALQPGESGEIVVTHLATRDFPFIRYRTGDVGVIDDMQCPCGRGLPLLKSIEGRTTDFIVAQDGTVMHGLALIYVIRDIPGVRTFKIVQESLDDVRVLLVPEDHFDTDAVEVIRAGFKTRLGEQTGVHVETVPEIPLEASGKFRYVVSRVDASPNTSELAQ